MNILLESEFHIEIPSATEQRPELPQSVWLLPPYPNPFNSTTRLRFELTEAGSIKLEIFNLLWATGCRVSRRQIRAGKL